jgi:hypothetical protein
MNCVASALNAGGDADGACFDKADDKFFLLFDKAELKGGCSTTGDSGATHVVVDACVSALRSQLDVAGNVALPLSKCAALKAKAAAKQLGVKLKCHDKALSTGLPVDSNCLLAAEVLFESMFAKAEAKGDCLTLGDLDDVENEVDDCLEAVIAALPPPTTTTTTLPPACSPEPSSVTGVTARHNQVRANVSPPANPPLPPLCYDASVASVAQQWADGCTWAHRSNLQQLGLGENLYAYTTSGPPPATPQLLAVDAWAAEASNYNYAANSCSGVCGHYTQVVWRNSDRLGCAVKQCTTGSPFAGFPTWWFVVCNYQPPGNYVGQRPY